MSPGLGPFLESDSNDGIGGGEGAGLHGATPNGLGSETKAGSGVFQQKFKASIKMMRQIQLLN